MLDDLDPVDRDLLDNWQRGFPLVPRPFRVIAAATGISVGDALARFRRLQESGVISRIGATCRPNTAGASTLAAIAAPDHRIDAVAAIISAEPGVNHSYLRENAWNIWFVATGPDRAAVHETLGRIGCASGLTVLDLPLVRPFNVDLGFAFDGRSRTTANRHDADPSAIRPGDRAIIQAMSSGLAVEARPFRRLANAEGRTEADVLDRIAVLASAGIFSRIGIIVRHRALGWRANAMVVWRLPEDEAARIGPVLADMPGVTLCYQRRPDPVHWPYTLYCMIHSRSRSEALSVLDRARQIDGLARVPHQVLFSLRCFKQTGALIDARGIAA